MRPSARADFAGLGAGGKIQRRSPHSRQALRALLPHAIAPGQEPFDWSEIKIGSADANYEMGDAIRQILIAKTGRVGIIEEN